MSESEIWREKIFFKDVEGISIKVLMVIKHFELLKVSNRRVLSTLPALKIKQFKEFQDERKTKLTTLLVSCKAICLLHM